MDGFGSGQRYSGAVMVDTRRVEIVSGKGLGSTTTQIYTGRARRSPDLCGYSGTGTRSSLSAATTVAATPWSFRDPEMRRRKRIAKYKVYSVEGKIKASLKRGFRWIKNKCSEIVRGF